MLDIIRKKSADWGVKIIFGIIIIVFIFFFGYSQMSKRAGNTRGGAVVARVNGTVITRPEFQLAYDNTYRMYQNIFKGKEGEPLPDGVRKSVVASALNQLVQQTLIKDLGDKLDIGPTSLELADMVRSLPVAKNEDGQFDPYLYKHRWLPYFAQKYNMDYEDLLRSDLVSQKVQDVFAAGTRLSLARSLYDIANTKWSFEVTEFEKEENARAGSGGRTKKVGPVSIAERGQVLPADVDVATWGRIFSIRNGNAPFEPVKAGDKWYIVKLTKLDLPPDAKWEKEKDGFIKTLSQQREHEYFQTWLSSLMKNADIKRYIAEEN